MRLAVCALSAVLLSGCTWLGGVGNAGQGGSFFGKSAHHNSQYNLQRGAFGAGQHNPCVVQSPRAPIPRGCDPASVTIGTASGGFPQQPNFGGGQYANAGFGSHAGVAGQQAALYQPRKRLRKPKLRGNLSLGLEKSISGDLLTAQDNGLSSIYNPQAFNEGFVVGSQASGSVTTTSYTANDVPANLVGGNIYQPFGFESSSIEDISFSDAHSTPIRIAGGVEYIVNPKNTLFANIGYTESQGEGTTATVDGTLYREVSEQSWIANPANPGAFLPNGDPQSNVSFIPNQEIARFAFDFNDLRRVDLEVGARHYFDPVVKNQGYKTVTPFVGASVGASHLNAVSLGITQEQLFYSDAYESSGAVSEYYTVDQTSENVEIADSQWVPSGQLNAGFEWQVTPKTALAFESGLRFEGARKYSNGERGDTNIAIPVTVRGSYNF